MYGNDDTTDNNKRLSSIILITILITKDDFELQSSISAYHQWWEEKRPIAPE
jgi:hypothetical protein